MNLIKGILGGVSGALSGATDGAISIDKVVAIATAAAAKRSDNSLTKADAKPVAEAIAAEMPAPRAMEALWPQVTRQMVVFAGGVMAGIGILSATDNQSILALFDAIVSGNTEAIGGTAVAVAMIGWRVISTWVARSAAKA